MEAPDISNLQFLKAIASRLIEECTDEALLDLICKLLLRSGTVSWYNHIP